jgi:hypothetical protein
MLAALFTVGAALQSQAADMKLEVQLLWATDDAQSPNPKHKPVDANLKKKLKQLPLKWSNYYEETRKTLEVPLGATRRLALSDLCETEIKNVDGTRIEVTHFGRGKKVGTRTQPLPKGEMLVLGGNAPDATAWLIVLRQVE